jgi:sugar phosphate isomerase/epimerase
MALEFAFPYYSCPPLLGTFSFGATPFFHELPTHTAFPPDDAREEQSLRWCQTVAQSSGLGNLEWVYGRDIKGTLVEICSSIVVRSEHQFTADEHRLSLRKHVYERAYPRTPYYLHGAPTDPRCGPTRALAYDKLLPSERFCRYLGFVDLRWAEDAPLASPLALGVLAVPKDLLSSAVTLITGGYGFVFGGPTFPATVFSMADPTTGGAMCAQACVIIALGLLSDRGARILGSHSITFLASPLRPHTPATRSAGCIASHTQYAPNTYYSAGGLTPRRMYDLLARRDSQGNLVCRVSPELVGSNDRARHTDRLVTRLIEAYVDARFPVILAVDAHAWLRRDIDSGRSPYKPAPGKEGHAVVVVGYSRTGPGPNDLSFLIHDPSDRPFAMKGRSFTLEAAWAFDYARHQRGTLNLLPVADSRIRRHLHSCIDWLRGPDGDALHHMLGVPGPDLSTELSRYLGVQPAAGYDLKLLLLDPAAVRPLFQPPIDRACLTAVTAAIGALPGRRYWCVVGLRGNQLRHLWLFDAETSSPHTRPCLILEISGIHAIPRYTAPVLVSAWETAQVLAPSPLTPPRKPEAKAAPLPRIDVSVITSCSSRPLREVITDVVTATGTTTFDLMVIRDVDVREFETACGRQVPQWKSLGGRPKNPVTRFLAMCGVYDPVATWFENQFRAADRQLGRSKEAKCRVTALASYMPWLSAIDNTMREWAIRALTNTVLVACRLTELKRMREAIVETTCGTRHDPCWCPACVKFAPQRRCHVSSLSVKRRILLDSLSEVIRRVRKEDVSARNGHKFYIALEYEPGVSYLLNSEAALNHVFAAVERDPLLREHVGLNVDIAHMRIDGVPAGNLDAFAHRILHSHVADHPELLHTRDLPPGMATPGLTRDSPYLDYFRLLARRAASVGSRGYTGLPFSGACAIELEGVERTDWMYTSVPIIRHVAEAARRWQ